MLVYFIGNMATYFILSDKYAIVNHVKNFMSKGKSHLIRDKLEDINKILSIYIGPKAFGVISLFMGLIYAIITKEIINN